MHYGVNIVHVLTDIGLILTVTRQIAIYCKSYVTYQFISKTRGPRNL